METIQIKDDKIDNKKSNDVNSNANLISINKFKNNILSEILNFLDTKISYNTKIWIIEKLNDRFDEIYDAYSITEKKFKYRKRDSWEMYITHINWVLDIYINKLYNLKEKLYNLDNNKEDDRKKAIEYVKNEICIVATIIEHDSIEDTDATMEWLNERYTINKLVWFTTLLLSKKPFSFCIENEVDRTNYIEIRKTWILNEKWLLSDLIKNKIQISEEIKIIEYIELNENNENKYENWDELIKYTFHDDHQLTQNQIIWLKLYWELEDKYKKARNELYFEHYKSIFSLIKHAKKILKDKDLYFSREDFKTIIHNTIIIKLADRMHNLNDLPKSWEKRPNRIENKLIETEKYLLPLAKEFNKEIYLYMINEIYRIRIELNKINIENIIK